MASRTAVVIPYYQNERGVLREAVLSAASQVHVPQLEIIVVDDGAPAPARDELDGLDLPNRVTLKLIEQPNRGPGAARNRALDSAHPDTVYVAFLDSDDRWTNDHLRHAQYILNKGYDLYFSDLWFSAYRASFFARQGVQIYLHRCLDHANRFYELIGDLRLDLIRSRNMLHTSTAVYRFEKFPFLRFPEAFYMGEDLTFWIELASRTKSIAFHHQVECVAGRGVHIFENSGWDSPKAIWRIHQYMKWRKWLHRTLLKDQLEIEENRKQIKKLRLDFVLNMLHEIRNGRAFANYDILRYMLTDPIAMLYMAPMIIKALSNKICS
jgi:succinoglycan biosynthesis protein ExoW